MIGQCHRMLLKSMITWSKKFSQYFLAPEIHNAYYEFLLRALRSLLVKKEKKNLFNKPLSSARIIDNTQNHLLGNMIVRCNMSLPFSCFFPHNERDRKSSFYISPLLKRQPWMPYLQRFCFYLLIEN